MKTFREMEHVGRARYVVTFHDGAKQHKDGSPFFDMEIFTNKARKNQFVRSLIASGYVPQGFAT